MKTDETANRRRGQNLMELRVAHGFTQKYIADHLGITQTYYSQIEAGNREASIRVLDSVAGVYQTSTHLILGFLDDEYSLSEVWAELGINLRQ